MRILVKIIAILLIVFGAIVVLGGIFATVDKPEDIGTSIVMLLIFGVSPILGGVFILRKHKKKVQKTKFEKPNMARNANASFDREQVKVEEQTSVVAEDKKDKEMQQYEQSIVEQINNTEESTLTVTDNRPSEMADIFPIKVLKSPNIFHKLFKTNPKINAIIEINNLLGTTYLRDINVKDIQGICTRYKTNLRGNILENVKELYTRYLEECLKDYLLSNEDCGNLAHLTQLLLLQEKEVTELHNKFAGEIYKRIYDETLSGSKLGKYNEEYVDKLQKDIRLPDEIADKIANDCRQNYLLNQFAIIRKDQQFREKT